MKDLHIHTKYSDGELDEFEIIEEIKKSKVKEFAIADHDTIEGSKKVFDILKNTNSDLIFHSSVELTCRANDYMDGINIHLLLQDFDYNDPKILDIVQEISILRRKKIEKMKKYVENAYKINISDEEIDNLAKNTNSFGKPHMYMILQKHGNYDREEYYDIMDDFDSREYKLDSTKVIRFLKNNCKTILAHPIEIMDEYDFTIEDLEKFVIHLKSIGLTGIETHHSSQNIGLQQQLTQIAKKYDLIESCGSDFHGENIKPGLKIGQIVKE